MEIQNLVFLQSFVGWSLLKHDFALRIWSSAHLWIHPTSVEIDWKGSKHAAYENYSASHIVIFFQARKMEKIIWISSQIILQFPITWN